MLPFDKLNQPIWQVSPYPIIVTSFEADLRARKIVYVNAAFSSVTGYTSVEAVGMPATLLHGPTTDQTTAAACEAALRKGKPFEATFLRCRKDGSEYTSHATVAPLVEPVGPPDFLISIEMPMPQQDHAIPADGSVQPALVPLTLPMPMREYPDGRMPRHLRSHAGLEALKALWINLRGERPLPLRKEFDLDTVKRWASHISVVTVTRDLRLQFRLFGTELARVYGRDLTGRFLDELTPTDLWSVITLHYKEVTKTRLPLFAPISIANGRWYTEVSRLLLPLAADDDVSTVAFVLAADYSRTAL
jgi:PAS domain S-box-containing protein